MLEDSIVNHVSARYQRGPRLSQNRQSERAQTSFALWYFIMMFDHGVLPQALLYNISGSSSTILPLEQPR